VQNPDITGFFYIVNFGLSQAEIDQQFAIAKEFFALPEEEQMKYRAPLEAGNCNWLSTLRLARDPARSV
jgi:isopenicillin N synthase-like dioxygenase